MTCSLRWGILSYYLSVKVWLHSKQPWNCNSKTNKSRCSNHEQRLYFKIRLLNHDTIVFKYTSLKKKCDFWHSLQIKCVPVSTSFFYFLSNHFYQMELNTTCDKLTKHPINSWVQQIWRRLSFHTVTLVC